MKTINKTSYLSTLHKRSNEGNRLPFRKKRLVWRPRLNYRSNLSAWLFAYSDVDRRVSVRRILMNLCYVNREARSLLRRISLRNWRFNWCNYCLLWWAMWVNFRRALGAVPAGTHVSLALLRLYMMRPESADPPRP